MCVKSVLFCLSVSSELLRIQANKSIFNSGMGNEKSLEVSSCLSGCRKMLSPFFLMESAVPSNKLVHHSPQQGDGEELFNTASRAGF